MLPIILLAGFLSFVGYKLGTSRDKKLRPVSFGAVPGAMSATRQGIAPPGAPSRTPYLDFMTRIVTSGKVPNQNVVDAAYGEAYALGDVATMQTIQQLVVQWAQAAALASAPQEQILTGAEEGPADMDLGDYEVANPAPQASPQATPQAPATNATMACPIDGIPVDDWCRLVKALKTKSPDHHSDNYLGAWEHNRRRLKQLGIDESSLKTEEGQYVALASDLADYHKGCRKLFEDFCGDVVEVEGQALPVTMSGVLGLLKAAGPKGAEGWLRNPEDRKAFPQTTAAFVRCNGHF